ncbi:MAG TPA: hypothetical protein VIM58_07145 [Candidatus Methylacidiphilales bacterium]
MRNFLFFNWRQKLACLFLAVILWVLLKEQIEPGAIHRAWLEVTGTTSPVPPLPAP